jgi:hypothetical protein
MPAHDRHLPSIPTAPNPDHLVKTCRTDISAAGGVADGEDVVSVTEQEERRSGSAGGARSGGVGIERQVPEDQGFVGGGGAELVPGRGKTEEGGSVLGILISGKGK